MSKIGGFVFLLFLCNTPHTCRTQRVSGAPVIMATKDILATTVATVKSANIDAARAQNDIEKLKANLKNNVTAIRSRINTIVKDVLANFQGRIDGLGVDISDVTAKVCAIPISSVESAGQEILMDANSCVSNTGESIERELNDTYSSIESILARINSEQILAETCVAEYDKTEVGIWDAIAAALCVTQAKERILSAIKDELFKYSDAKFLHVLYVDAISRLKICHDRSRISSFIADTDSVFVKIKNCVSN